MNIFEKTEDLAVSLRESPEFKEFLETKSLIEATPKAREVLKEYRARQFALELAEIAGEGIDEVNDALAEICAAMEQDVLLSRYLTAEFNLFCLMKKVQEIFSDNLGLLPDASADFPGIESHSGMLN